MTDSSTVLVLGASGRFGGACVKVFAAMGWRVIALTRRPRRGEPLHGVEGLVAEDISPANILARLQHAGRIDVVVHAMNPAYTDAAWTEHVVAMMDHAIGIARSLGATLMFPGNVYNFGADMPPVLDENTPQQPTSVKGKLRVEAEQRMRKAVKKGGLCAVTIRAGDFFGNGSGSWFDQVLTDKLVSGTFTYPGPLDVATPWAYLPDLAQTFAEVAEQRQQLQGLEVLHFSGHSLTGRDWLQALQPLAETNGWVAAGQPLRTAALPWPLIGLMGLFSAKFSSLSQVRYLYATPHALANQRLVALLGSEPHTPLNRAASFALADLGLPRGNRISSLVSP